MKQELENAIAGHKPEETGIDDDGNKVLTYNKNKPEWVTMTKLKMPSGKIVSIDPNEQSFEAYNPNNFAIIFENNHPNPAERLYMPFIRLEKDDFAFIPHRYYIPWIEKVGNSKGESFTIVENYGDSMFIGNKKASRPTEQKKQF